MAEHTDEEKQLEKERDEKGRHQNDFINQRLTWLGTFSSLLFVANGFGKYPVLIPLVGFGIAMSIWAGTSAANVALDRLDRNVRGWRRPFMPGAFIPPLFGAAWLVVLARNLCK
jgi:hypothetical protein